MSTRRSDRKRRQRVETREQSAETSQQSHPPTEEDLVIGSEGESESGNGNGSGSELGDATDEDELESDPDEDELEGDSSDDADEVSTNGRGKGTGSVREKGVAGESGMGKDVKSSSASMQARLGRGHGPSPVAPGNASAAVALAKFSSAGEARDHRRFAREMHVADVSSDEEKPRNTIGNVPLEWYNNLEHIGYDVDGRKIQRRYGLSGVDAVLASRDDPNYKWTVVDERNGEQRVLSERELLIIRRLQAGRFAHSQHNPYPDYVPYFSSKTEKMPISGAPIPKRRFIPSLHEERKIAKLVRAIKAGKITFEKKKKKDTEVYLLWKDEDQVGKRRGPEHIPAPKTAPPSHAHSYRPPEEYVPTKEELAEWEKLPVSQRPYGEFVPQRFDSLRHVPAYASLMRERFDRCLDLYMAPRAMRKRLHIDPESLIPKLPDPKELRPYPTTLALVFRGHTGLIRSISLSPNGEFVASGADDGTIRIWEVATGRCLQIFKVDGTVHCLAWNPRESRPIIAAAVGQSLLFFNTGTGDASDAQELEALMKGPLSEQAKDRNAIAQIVPKPADGQDSDEEDAAIATGHDGEDGDGDVSSTGSDAEDATEVPETSRKKKSGTKLRDRPCDWRYFAKSKQKKSATASDALLSSLEPRLFLRIDYRNKCDVAHVAWHHRGDYIATASPKAVSTAVVFHILSKPGKSQCPFRSVKGAVQRVRFHPERPVFFLATRHSVRVYNLQKAALVKKLKPNVKWLSSMHIHPSGDHVITGSYDRVVNWFDLDLSSQPYKALKYHKNGVRQTAFHERYPLMATCSDDGNIHIFHAMVYSDLLRNPLIVPLTILRGKTNAIKSAASEDSGPAPSLGVLDCIFHPTQPWILSANADNCIRLYQNIH